MTAWAGITHHATAQPQFSLEGNPNVNSAINAGGKAADSSSGTGSTSSSSGASAAAATISANDFLTLLVTEMQNQDPTANTDPNEYVNQLVNVNSLEQLISINQTLNGALGSSSSSGSTGTTGGGGAPTGSSQPVSGAVGHSVSMLARPSAPTAFRSGLSSGVAGSFAVGNLTVPPAGAAAGRIATALNGLAPAR